MKNRPAKFARATKRTLQREKLSKTKMASSDDRFTFEIMHVLRFGNELNEEL